MKVFIIGGGPAGMLCSIISAQNGADVTLIEKNEKLGKKLYITGKGRCNLTNCNGFDDYMNNIISNNKFLYTALKTYDSTSCMYFFENNGLPLKIERGNRIFPQTDKSSDVIRTLTRKIEHLGVTVLLNEKVTDIIVNSNVITNVVTTKGTYEVDKVVIATGGLSYPLTGSTGDGYKFAQKVGHTIVPTVPALVGIILDFGISINKNKIQYNSLGKLQGISLKNIKAKIIDKSNGRIIFEEFGEMLFTADGVSGPIMLTISSKINRLSLNNLFLSIDLKPALDENVLEKRIIKDFNENLNKQIKNVLNLLVPSGLINTILKLAEINPEKQINSINKIERKNLITVLKNLNFNIKSLQNVSTAIVTAGGISVKEINPKTMQSKLINNLYFAGEIIDVDALTGGYNLQIAFSTGYCAGKYINEQ